MVSKYSYGKPIHIEICKSCYIKGKWNIRIGDITGSTGLSNCNFEEVLKEISDRMKEEKEGEK